MDEEQGKLELSVVIPAYNEALRIGGTLEAICAAELSGARVKQIVVVDDGSTDGTAEVVRTYVTHGIEIKSLKMDRNRGKGAAVRTGVAAASIKGGAILMSDADLATPIEQVDKLIDALAEGYGVVIGSRVAPGAVLDPPRPWLRRVLAWGYRVMRRRVMLASIGDTQCGFKLFETEAARRIFEVVETDGFAFDCEALGLAKKMGYRIKEVGVIWNEQPGSSVRPLRDTIGMLWQLKKIKQRLKQPLG